MADSSLSKQFESCTVEVYLRSRASEDGIEEQKRRESLRQQLHAALDERAKNLPTDFTRAFSSIKNEVKSLPDLENPTVVDPWSWGFLYTRAAFVLALITVNEANESLEDLSSLDEELVMNAALPLLGGYLEYEGYEMLIPRTLKEKNISPNAELLALASQVSSVIAHPFTFFHKLVDSFAITAMPSPDEPEMFATTMLRYVALKMATGNQRQTSLLILPDDDASIRAQKTKTRRAIVSRIATLVQDPAFIAGRPWTADKLENNEKMQREIYLQVEAEIGKLI